ncbi:hypothetical protein JOB18_039762 [Solea senegalensis]|uniref:Uncharacterized protein n=1 Tax=Solea senegalensis TaxID=28829 RepID=A0AAV6Q1V6_SOLSE|nr:hypothetical protein JOB18_039762 [Solea senegalensis]
MSLVMRPLSDFSIRVSSSVSCTTQPCSHHGGQEERESTENTASVRNEEKLSGYHDHPDQTASCDVRWIRAPRYRRSKVAVTGAPPGQDP